jgi:uncharacterized SAM-binding protein YcdF (DUF218 family)
VPEYDAVVVLGGGVRDGGALPPWVEARFEKALELAAAEACIICLSAGTVWRPPPLDETARPIFESVAGAGYLLRRGFPPERILTEMSSYDTIGNAYFCRTIHTDPAGLRRLAVVTSEFHMPRAETIFRWVFSLDSGDSPYTLSFLATPDAGMAESLRIERRAKEDASMATMAALIARFTTLAALHRWLFAEHRAYAAGVAPERAPTKAMESY